MKIIIFTTWSLLDPPSPAIEMRSKQDDIERVAGELEVKERELMSLQAKLQEAEKILVNSSHFSTLD